MDPGYIAFLLLAVGLAVLVVEVFVPSGGLLAALTLCCLLGSVYFAWKEWWETNTLAFWAYIGGVAFLIPLTLGGSFFMLPRTEFGRRLLQEPPTREETASFTQERAALAAAVGRRGTTVTLHNPGGLVEVDGVRFHSEGRGMMLDPGEAVDILGVRGNRLLVRLADGPVPEALSPPPEGPAPTPGTPLEPQPRGDADSAEPTSPTPPVIDPDPDRPGGHLDPHAPVGYAHESEPPEPAPEPSSDRPAPERPSFERPSDVAETPPSAPPRDDEIADPFAEDAEREGLG